MSSMARSTVAIRWCSSMPLYYRLAALTGWLFYRAGVIPWRPRGRGPTAVGRRFSIDVGSGLWPGPSGRLAAEGRGWAGLLAASTPIYGGISFEVRADMLGVAFQTTGILLLLKALVPACAGAASLSAAAVCFAVAMCIKQQYVVAPLVSLALITGAWYAGD